MGRPGDLFGPPIREASARGGSGRFNWDDVKKDEKFRDTYLGHSLRAPVGRWQKGKDLTWYAKATPTNAADEKAQQKEDRLAEIRKIKEAEEDALAEALGFKVERKVKNEGVSQEELASALKDEDVEVERAQGLGFGKSKSQIGEADGSVKPRIGASLPDGSVVQDHPAPATSTNGISVDVDAAVKLEEEGEGRRVEREGREGRERRKHRHHRDRDDDEERRHRYRHRRPEDRSSRRSRSPDRRRERESYRDQHHDSRRDTERHRGSDRGRDDRKRDDSPRRRHTERRDDDRRERDPSISDRHHRRRERSR
jgi:hypothetical protein